ncbi:MAG: tRNA (adenosine(37)-N6)-threonylcarbamoyltransferase complex ATPase subunit type 1 TsaE [Oscillospiraceae bacterium]|nr:tRNA (adenosine(37)-N6)-threonylcarbamoyltransferase complex ATPase subunit type 1 TsaE [Oscillospiraceae bacterium]
MIITTNENETVLEGEKFGRRLTSGSVVALYGGLGAGKTVFTRGLAMGLGISDFVSSPTFTIVNEYPGNIPLFHFDMYRLENDEELFDIGWDDYLDRGGVCVVEWADKVPKAFSCAADDAHKLFAVRIESMGDDTRHIDISCEGGGFSC